MYNHLKIIGFTSVYVLVPLVTHAQPADFKSTIGNITNVLLSTIPVLVGAALLLFMWGLVEYVLSAAGDAKKESKQRMLWGIIGLFVVTSIWGIVSIVGGSFGI